MRLLDRAQLMDLMLFPQNTKDMVIVPSNKEGTGFLNHCYEPKFLKGFISEMEFNVIVLICSRIAARSYSQKQVIDRQNISTEVWILIKVACAIALLGIALLMVSAVKEWHITEYIASVMLLLAMTLAVTLGIGVGLSVVASGVALSPFAWGWLRRTVVSRRRSGRLE